MAPPPPVPLNSYDTENQKQNRRHNECVRPAQRNFDNPHYLVNP
jgi:hypothetical protein